MKICTVQDTQNRRWGTKTGSLQVILEKQRFATLVGSEVESSWKDGGSAELFQRLMFQCTSFQVCPMSTATKGKEKGRGGGLDKV